MFKLVVCFFFFFVEGILTGFLFASSIKQLLDFKELSNLETPK